MNTATVNRLPIIGVMGSGDKEDTFPHVAPLGKLIAEMGFHVLTGGGFGVMQEASRGFTDVTPRKGMCIGVLPSQTVMGNNPFRGYPNPFVEINIQTHLVRDGWADDIETRNHINILTSDAVIFCPGNDGTHSELEICVKYDRPAIIYLGDGHGINGMGRNELVRYGFPFADDLEDVRLFLESCRSRYPIPYQKT